MTALVAWWVPLGGGLHVQEALHYGSPRQWLLIIWIGEIIYTTGLSFVKLSVVLFYFRVFGKIRFYRYILWVVAMLPIVWGIIINCMTVFVCVPVQSYWEGTPGRHCLNNATGFLMAAITNILIDIIILLLPLPVLWRLQLSPTRKLAVVGLFVCGYRSVLSSLVVKVHVVLIWF